MKARKKNKGRKTLIIRKTNDADLKDLLYVEKKAFGDEGPVIVDLVENLLNDASARPLLSLLAFEENKAIGHILFTKAHMTGFEDTVSVSLLAPLAVIPEFHSRGVGGKLIQEGLNMLSESGVELVFVLGHPGYYPRYGFKPAGILGFEAPYPIPEKDAGAWMTQELRPGMIEKVNGKVICADAMDRPEYWRE